LACAHPFAATLGALVTVLGLCVTLSGAAVLAVLLALLAMAALRGRLAMAVALAFALLVVVAVHPKLPRRAGLNELWPVASEWQDPWISSIALHDDAGELSRRYPEWETAWLIASDHPWRGVGAGNYQQAIREGSYRRIPTRPGPPEPDTQNLYLVLASSIGFPGLLAFLAMLLEGMSLAARASLPAARLEAADRALALGAFGSLLAYSIAAVWHPLLVRGIGIPLVAVLALAHHLHARAARE
jgi:O-antigen ligase